MTTRPRADFSITKMEAEDGVCNSGFQILTGKICHLILTYSEN